MSGGYDADSRSPRRPVGEASAWSQDQKARNEGDRGYPGRGYGGQGYGDQGDDGQTAGYQGQGYGGQDYDRAGDGDPGYGYDPRGSGPHRLTAGYGADYPARDDSFLPGFDRRDDFDGGDDPHGGRGQGRGRAGRYSDETGYDQSDVDARGTGPRNRDPRNRDPRGTGPRNRDPRNRDPRGTDPRGADPRRREGADPAALNAGRRPADGGRGDRGAGGVEPGARGSGPRDPREWDDRNYGRDDRGGGQDPRSGRKKATRWAPRILLLVVFGALLAGVLTGGLYVYHTYEAKYHPADYVGAGLPPTVIVHVPSDANSASLGPALVKLGVIASARAFTIAAEASSNPTGLEPGSFTLRHHMQASLAWAALLNPKNRVQLHVTIPEGKRVSQVILILAKDTKIPLRNFEQVIAHPARLGLPSSAEGKAEGYLFPATYTVEPHESALAILQAMVSRFNAEAAQANLPVAARRVGLSATQVIIEASMAQAEGGSVSDYPKIARVIINRLNEHMDLQFDSVLLYGLHAYAINVTDKQIATPGPYNDFHHPGLPPGPISNPGDAAIQAVLHPASGPWLYFLTRSGGKSTFSATPLPGQ